MRPLFEHSSTGDGDLDVRPAKRQTLFAICLVLQFAGYLILWLAFHAIKDFHGDYLTNPDRLPTGWYGPGTAYTAWVYSIRPIAALFRWRHAQLVLMSVAFACVGAGYLGSLRLLQNKTIAISATALLLLTALIALPLLALPQLPSGDLWAYVMYGRVSSVHGGNPYFDLPSAYAQDPFLPRMAWKNQPSVYGPIWGMCSFGLCRIAERLGGAPGTYLIVFKLFMFAAHLVNTLLIARILRILRPAQAMLSATLYAWNPLCLFEFCGGGHNDVLMLTLLLVAIWLTVAGRATTAVGAFAMAICTKLPAILCLPVYTLWIARREPSKGVRVFVTHVLTAIVVAAVLYAPFWRGLETLHSATNPPNLQVMWRSTASVIAQVVESHLSHGAPSRIGMDQVPPPGSMQGHVRKVVRTTSLMCFLVCFAPLTLRKVFDFDDWIERLICIYVAYLLFAAVEFNPWYATWLVPLAALTRKPSWLMIVSTMVLLVFYLPIPVRGLTLLYLCPLYALFFARVPTAIFTRATRR